MNSSKNIVAVIGGAQASTSDIKLAEEVGALLAKKGLALVCGGLGGVMEAACKGAVTEGGITVGILPGENRSSANPYVQLPIVTGIGIARNLAVVKSAQVVIAVGGSYGTLSEIAFARQSGIPVIGLNTWNISKNGREDDTIIRADTASDAVDKAVSLIRSNEQV